MPRTLCVVGLTLALGGCQKSTEESRSAEPAPRVETRPSPGADPMAGVTIETTQLADSIHVLVGAGGNIGVSAGKDGVVMIDDQFAPLAPKIRAAVRELGHGDPEFLINTHFHGDHTGGNPEFGSAASIIAHDNVRKRLAQKRTVRGKVYEPMAAVGLPVVTFAESVSLHLNGEEIRVQHLPRGHTDTDAIVLFTGSNVVHMGDQFFPGAFPFIDVEHGGDVLQFQKNVAAVLEQIDDQTKLIPGHGPVSGKAELAAFNQMLIDSIELVTRAKRAGKSLAEVQKAGMPSQYAGWSGGVTSAEDWLATVYGSVK